MAIETKAGLVAIELLLIDDVAECVAAVAKEESEIDKRVAAMRTTLASLPAADDADALPQKRPTGAWTRTLPLSKALGSSVHDERR